MITAIALGRTPVWADSSFTPPKILPNGKTEVPTDNIQTWLNCADIWDKDYKTLGQVMADTETLSALMADENAVDYLVRSKTWIKSEVLTPNSGEEPIGVCTASSYMEGHEPYKGFGYTGSYSDYWQAGDEGVSQWIQYTLPTSKAISQVYIKNLVYDGNNVIKDLKIYGIKNDTFTEISSKTLANNGREYGSGWSINDLTAYKAYRIEILSSYCSDPYYISAASIEYWSEKGICENNNAMTYIGLNNYAANTLLADPDWLKAICTGGYSEKVLNVKVPVMTGPRTPSGTCYANPQSSTYGYAYLAFDGNRNTKAGMKVGDMSRANWILGYTFNKKVKVYTYTIIFCNTYTNQYVNGFDVYGGSNKLNISKKQAPTISGVTAHRYYVEQNLGSYSDYELRIDPPTGPQEGAETKNDKMMYICEIQFYGREDV